MGKKCPIYIVSSPMTCPIWQYLDIYLLIISVYSVLHPNASHLNPKALHLKIRDVYCQVTPLKVQGSST